VSGLKIIGASSFRDAAHKYEFCSDVVRVEDVFAAQLHTSMGSFLPRDCDITTKCPTCAHVQTLQDAEVFLDGEETIYLCKNGCQPIVVVGPLGNSPWPERSYRLGQHVIVNAQDLFFNVSNPAGVIVIPGSLAALMKTRSEPVTPLIEERPSLDGTLKCKIAEPK